jgi:hypothetical protein
VTLRRTHFGGSCQNSDPECQTVLGEWAISGGVGSPHPDGENCPSPRYVVGHVRAVCFLGGIDCSAVGLLMRPPGRSVGTIADGDAADPGIYRRTTLYDPGTGQQHRPGGGQREGASPAPFLPSQRKRALTKPSLYCACRTSRPKSREIRLPGYTLIIL